MKIIILLSMIVLAGCVESTKPDANYVAYTAALKEQQNLESSKIDSIALAANACNGDARCVENVAAMAAISATAAAGGRASPQQYVPRPSMAAQIGFALVGQLGPLASAAVSWHQADTSARTSMAQYKYLDDVLSTAMTGMSSVAVNAKPNINVGGNYGDTQTHVGDNVGGDKVGGDKVNGDKVAGDKTSIGGDYTGRDKIGGDSTGRDKIAGDRIDNSGNYGTDNRQDSPGPIGPVCTGDTCQGTSGP